MAKKILPFIPEKKPMVKNPKGRLTPLPPQVFGKLVKPWASLFDDAFLNQLPFEESSAKESKSSLQKTFEKKMADQRKIIPFKKAPMELTKKKAMEGIFAGLEQLNKNTGEVKSVESKKNIWGRRLKDAGKLAKAIGRRDWYEAGWYTPYTRVEDFIRHPKSYLPKVARVAGAAGKLLGASSIPWILASEMDFSKPFSENSWMPEYEYTPIRGEPTIWE